MRITVVLVAFAFSLSVFLSNCTNTAYAVFIASSATLEQLTKSLPDPGAVEIGTSLITPSSPLYFLKALRERVELMLSSKKSQKINKHLEFAQRRLREVSSLIKSNHQDLIEPTVEQYKDFIVELDSLATNDNSSKSVIALSLARHLDILQRFYDSVGLPQAKMSIMSAIEKAEGYNRELLAKLDLAEQQKLIGEIALRQALACKFMAREASSSATIEPARQLLGQKVSACQKDIQTTLKDKLDELRIKVSPAISNNSP